MMYTRYYNLSFEKDFKEEDYLIHFNAYTSLFKDVEKPEQGYIPFHTVVYIRSTGNDIIEYTLDNNPKFYDIIGLNVKDSMTTIEDEVMLSALKYMNKVIPQNVLDDPMVGLPLKSFPSFRGGILNTTSEPIGAFIIVSVIIDKEAFDSIDLNVGYTKSIFDKKKYKNCDEFTGKVADTFIKVHKPKEV